jgi:putative flippase GtrA
VKQQRANAARYVIVGAANTLVYSTLLYVFLEVLSLNSTAAVTLAYAIAFPFHFAMNRIYVFRAAKGEIHGQVLRYAVWIALSYGLSLIIVFVGINVLNLPSWAVVAANVAATTLAGFLLAAVWVFR